VAAGRKHDDRDFVASPGALPAGPDRLPVPAVALIVLDGWGLAPPGPGNAISQARTPVFDELWERYPHTTLSASGRDVGLPAGQMGNSEVGHLNLGAGTVVKQDLARIDDAIADGRFFDNPALKAACETARNAPRGRLHLIGLISDGGVHSGWEHIEACIELAAQEGVPDIVVHVITDGRDTLPTSGARYVAEVERWLRRAGRIGTVAGRYYAMDRDRRWDRTQLAYEAIVHAQGVRAASAADAVAAAYERGETDEFIHPTVIGDYDGAADGDAVVHFNFRPDRARQLVRALGEADFDGFPRGIAPRLELTTLTEYQGGWDYPVAFAPHAPATTLAALLASRGERQLHVAETEKYAHVTYFFNGGHEIEWDGEERCLVDSPRDVPTYDHKPEMSARAAADAFRERWTDDGYRFAIINFANPDMVGHTGSIPAAVRAVEVVDGCLGEVVAAVHGSGGACIVTADHGNADNMLEPDGSPNTAHSTNPVPLIVTVDGVAVDGGGVLADVAPTALRMLGIGQPSGMTGRSLIVGAPEGAAS
jgi:2,3-bisphosphoglycerate-independent phosphoglycerate mutase